MSGMSPRSYSSSSLSSSRLFNNLYDLLRELDREIQGQWAEAKRPADAFQAILSLGIYDPSEAWPAIPIEHPAFFPWEDKAMAVPFQIPFAMNRPEGFVSLEAPENPESSSSSLSTPKEDNNILDSDNVELSSDSDLSSQKGSEEFVPDQGNYDDMSEESSSSQESSGQHSEEADQEGEVNNPSNEDRADDEGDAEVDWLEEIRVSGPEEVVAPPQQVSGGGEDVVVPKPKRVAYRYFEEHACFTDWAKEPLELLEEPPRLTCLEGIEWDESIWDLRTGVDLPESFPIGFTYDPDMRVNSHFFSLCWREA